MSLEHGAQSAQPLNSAARLAVQEPPRSGTDFGCRCSVNFTIVDGVADPLLLPQCRPHTATHAADKYRSIWWSEKLRVSVSPELVYFDQSAAGPVHGADHDRRGVLLNGQHPGNVPI